MPKKTEAVEVPRSKRNISMYVAIELIETSCSPKEPSRLPCCSPSWPYLPLSRKPFQLPAACQRPKAWEKPKEEPQRTRAPFVTRPTQKTNLRANW